jgi:alpha-L-rhamnosidase
MEVSIDHVNLEHYRHALGIRQDRPRISWRFAGDAKNWTQAEYEVEVVRSGHCHSFRQSSEASVLVPWPDTPLKVGEPATIRVRAFGGASGTASMATRWSGPVHVELAVRPADWTASLIEPTKDIDPSAPKVPILFRHEFDMKQATVRQARLYITAHGVYVAEINGQNVGTHVLAPGWTSYGHRLTYQTFDVSNMLKPGPNAICATVGAGWYCGRLGFGGGTPNIWGDRMGLSAQLVVQYQDGTRETVVTDDKWKWNTGSITSSELYDGEECDMRLDPKGWTTTDFRDDWEVVSAKTFPNKERLQPPDSPPVQRTEKAKPVQIFNSPSGRTVVDFGQNLVGWLRIRVQGATAGHTISFTHTEVLEHGEVATRPLRAAKAKDTLILAGAEPLVWEPKFTFHGFRYVQVDNWPSQGIDPSDLTAIVLHTDMERTGWFECSEPLLNKLHENIRWGMRGNFLSIPTDCPQRDERLGWTGDICVFANTANFLYDTHSMLDSWLKDVAAEQKADGKGVPPLVTPNALPFPNMAQAIWGDVVVSAPWDLYQAFGDKTLLLQQYESMKDWMDRGIPRDSRGLWDSSTFQLADWLDPRAPPDEPGNGLTDNIYVANAYLIRSTDLMVKISTTLGLLGDASRYQDAATKLRAAFVKEYITEAGRVAPDTQTAIALALYFEFFPTPEQALHAAARLKQLILQSARFKIATGFAGTPILGFALSQMGESQLFYRMLRHRKCPSWLYPVTMGATTVWERWDSMLPDGSINPGEMTSFNHYALGSVAHWMHTVMGGIRSGAPGWKEIIVEPVPGGDISHCKVSHLSPYGMITAAWKVEGGHFLLDVSIPPNSSATIKLPGTKDGLRVGSGEYSYRVDDYEAPHWPPLPIYPPFMPHDDDEP